MKLLVPILSVFVTSIAYLGLALAGEPQQQAAEPASDALLANVCHTEVGTYGLDSDQAGKLFLGQDCKVFCGEFFVDGTAEIQPGNPSKCWENPDE